MSKILFKTDNKNDLETNIKITRFLTHFEFQKLTQISPEIIPKFTKILLFATSGPSCCSHDPPGCSEMPKWPPKVLPRRRNSDPRCSRGAKMVPRGAPGVQKWGPEMSTRRHRALQMASEEKKQDMLKWMLGCSRSVKMVFRNAVIEDSSKIKL